MFAESAALAFAAALSPTALLVGAVYLGSARPRVTALCYLAGAVAMAVLAGTVVLVALRAGGLHLPQNRTPRYGLRLGLGIVMVAGGGAVLLYKPRPREPGQPGRGLASRLVASPSPRTAFAAGAVLFLPSLTYVAAVQVIAAARTGIGVITGALALVTAIYLSFVWLPLVVFLAAPGTVTRVLAHFSGWLRAHGHAVLAAGLLAGGVIVGVDGVVGLARIT
jgi:Sap-like sulfolipid-1-addressing protein